MDIRARYRAAVLFDDTPTVLGPNFSDTFRLVTGSQGFNGWTLAASGILTPGAGDTLDVLLQQSVDGISFSTITTLPQLTSVNLTQRATLGGSPMPFLRLSITEAGSGTWTNLLVALVGSGPRVLPA